MTDVQIYRTGILVVALALIASGQIGKPNNCFTNPQLTCQNGGSCFQYAPKLHPHSYKCRCPFTHCGKMCQERNPCYVLPKNPCLHAGMCICTGPYHVTYRCSCIKPFEGKHCELLPDLYNPCLYPHQCPPETTCEPNIFQVWDRVHKKRIRYAMAYHCRRADGSHEGFNLPPDSSFPEIPCGRKQKGCDSEQYCHRDKCIGVPLLVDGQLSTKAMPSFVTATFPEVPPLSSSHVCGELSHQPGDFNDIDVSGIDENEIFEDRFSVHDLEATTHIRQRVNLMRRLQKRKRGPEKRESLTTNDPSASDRDRLMRTLGINRLNSEKKRHVQRSKRSIVSPCEHGGKCIPTSVNTYHCQCPRGTRGRNCSQGCPHGTFGPPLCKKRCSGCQNEKCDFKAGICREACVAGWRGSACTEKNGITVFMVTTFSGLFTDAFKETDSLEYKDFKSKLQSWILPLCSVHLKYECSLHNVKLSSGSVRTEYEVLFSPEATVDREVNLSSQLAAVLKKHAAWFNSTVYKVNAHSIQVTRVQQDLVDEPSTDNINTWLLSGVTISAGTLVSLVMIVLWYKYR